MNYFEKTLKDYSINDTQVLLDYIDSVIYNYSDEFNEYVDVSFQDSEIENRWLCKLYVKDVNTTDAAKIIERAYFFYKYLEEQEELERKEYERLED